MEFQSRRTARYEAALADLAAAGRTYACRCSRSQLAAGQAADASAEPVYPGTCRADPQAASTVHALRFAIPTGAPPLEFEDAFQGRIRQDCGTHAGDFIVRRRDGLAAYHLAVVVDDADSGVSEVVRGADLLDSTPRQILIQRSLGLPTPCYGHLPLLVEPDGRKLAKSRRSLPLTLAEAPRQLWQALDWLGQAPPAELAGAPITELWAWAIPNWTPGRLRGVRERRLPAPPVE